MLDIFLLHRSPAAWVSCFMAGALLVGLNFIIEYTTDSDWLFAALLAGLVLTFVLFAASIVALLQSQADKMFGSSQNGIFLAIRDYTLRMVVLFGLYFILKKVFLTIEWNILAITLNALLAAVTAFGALGIVLKEDTMKETYFELFDSGQSNLVYTLIMLCYLLFCAVLFYFGILFIGDLIAAGAMSRVVGIGAVVVYSSYILGLGSAGALHLFVKINEDNGSVAHNALSEEEDDFIEA